MSHGFTNENTKNNDLYLKIISGQGGTTAGKITEKAAENSVGAGTEEYTPTRKKISQRTILFIVTLLVATGIFLGGKSYGYKAAVDNGIVITQDDIRENNEIIQEYIKEHGVSADVNDRFVDILKRDYHGNPTDIATHPDRFARLLAENSNSKAEVLRIMTATWNMFNNNDARINFFKEALDYININDELKNMIPETEDYLLTGNLFGTLKKLGYKGNNIKEAFEDFSENVREDAAKTARAEDYINNGRGSR